MSSKAFELVTALERNVLLSDVKGAGASSSSTSVEVLISPGFKMIIFVIVTLVPFFGQMTHFYIQVVKNSSLVLNFVLFLL